MTPERIVISDALGAPASEIVIGRDVSAILPERDDRRRVALLHQPGYATTVADRVSHNLTGVEVHRFLLPDREEAKTWATVAAVHEWMAELEIGRSDTVVGIGGGAATDVAGFVAATWLRGVEAAYVPTTLLAAVDASIGGKTGINLRGKNLVGAFWHPTRVTIDLDILEALPTSLKREGWAEIIKAGFIADPTLVEDFRHRGQQAPLSVVLPKAVAVKAALVSEDFTEQGRRAFLNFGHTIGHSVEMAEGIPHGHAVAVGMVGAAAASAHVTGFDSDIRELVEMLGLPVSSSSSRETIRSRLSLDKKRDAGGLRMVLLRAYGDPILQHVDDTTVNVGVDAIVRP